MNPTSLIVLVILTAFVAGLATGLIYNRRQARSGSSAAADPNRLGHLFGYRQKYQQAALFEAISDAVISVDSTSTIVAWAGGAEAMFGFSAQEAIGRTVEDLLKTERTEPLVDSIAQGIKNAGVWRNKLVRYNRAGKKMTVATTISVRRNRRAEVIGYLLVEHDISAQVQAEDELRTREVWWRALIENTADMILVVDDNLNFAYISPSVEQILGYDISKIVGAPAMDWLPIIASENTVLARWWDQLKMGQPVGSEELGIPLELKVRDKAGKWRWLELILSRLDLPSLKGVIVNIREISARVEAEQSLFAASENLKALIQFAPTPIIAQDRNQHITVWNPAAEKLFGWTVSEMIGHPIPLIFAPITATGDIPTDINEVRKRSIPLGDTQSGRTLRMVSFRRDQTPIMVSLSTGFIRDTATQFNGTISVLVDITAQQNSQLKMRQQYEYLIALHDTAVSLLNRLDVDRLLNTILVRATLFLNTPDGFLGMLDPASNRITLRGGLGFYEKALGASMASTDGLVGEVYTRKRLFVVDDYSVWEKRIDLAQSQHLYAAIGMPLIVGEKVVGVIGLIRTTPQPFSLDEITQLTQLVELACLALDSAQLFAAAQQELVERSRAEVELQRLNGELEQRIEARTLELKQRELELRTVIDSMSEGLIYFQTDLKTSRIQFVNQAISEMVGFKQAELIGQSFAIFAPTALPDKDNKASREEQQDTIEQAYNSGSWRNEAVWRRMDGSYITVALSVRQVPSVEKGLRGVMVVRDITAEKQLSDQKMRFIANASHELRTPLTHLKTRMYLIRRQPERSVEHLAVLDQSISRMIRLVEDMLDTTRFERGWGQLERRYLVIQDLINELLPNIQSDIQFKHIQFVVDQPTQPLGLEADPDRLMQVLHNLSANAISYTAEGGHVQLRVMSEDNGVAIAFEDSGLGLAPENFERVFEPFFRVELGSGRGMNLGLGLSIAREIVRLHDGHITVSSQLGVGSIFKVWLPLSALTVSATPLRVDSNNPQSPGPFSS